MEPEGLLPHVQGLSISPYAEPDQSRPCFPIPQQEKL